MSERLEKKFAGGASLIQSKPPKSAGT
jgi:chemotaxis receptor (MCP) glutamine deamidase CheD